MEYPFVPTTISVRIPRAQAEKFHGCTAVSVELNKRYATVPSGARYELRRLPDGYAVLRTQASGPLSCVGEFNEHTVRKTLSDKLSADVGLIRAAVYGVSFPAPLAFVMRNKDLVHPGACFDAHPECITLRSLYAIKRNDARCAICDGAFV